MDAIALKALDSLRVRPMSASVFGLSLGRKGGYFAMMGKT